MSDSSAVDAAVLAKLNNDATLIALLTDLCHMDIAPDGRKKFGIVSQVIHEDEPMFDAPDGSPRTAYEKFTYLIKAVVLATDQSTAKAAAARINALLNGVVLTITGYSHMSTKRIERVRYTEVDAANSAIRWQHLGGRYEVFVSPNE